MDNYVDLFHMSRKLLVKCWSLIKCHILKTTYPILTKRVVYEVNNYLVTVMQIDHCVMYEYLFMHRVHCKFG